MADSGTAREALDAETVKPVTPAVCHTCGDQSSPKRCVGCGKTACPKCRGDVGEGYWNHKGKKGYACGQCIEAGRAYEGGPLAVGREVKAYAHAILVPEVFNLVDVRVKRMTDTIEDSIKKLTGSVDRLNPNKLLWQAALVFGLVNVATVIATLLLARQFWR